MSSLNEPRIPDPLGRGVVKMRDLNAFGDALKAQGFMVVQADVTQEDDIDEYWS